MLKYQFNKISMQKLKKDLQIREKALPTLKAKETALRLEVKKAQAYVEEKEAELQDLFKKHTDYSILWQEFPRLLMIENCDINLRNIAGVKIPELKNVQYHIRDYSLFAHAAWIPGAIEVLKSFIHVSIELNLAKDSLEILYNARKKTTQKVNLYEKVQIPEHKDAILKIKRYLEDEENLAKAAQKIVKVRTAAQEEQELLA